MRWCRPNLLGRSLRGLILGLAAFSLALILLCSWHRPAPQVHSSEVKNKIERR